MDKLIEQAIKNCKINKYEKYFEQVCKEYKRLLDAENQQLNLQNVSNNEVAVCTNKSVGSFCLMKEQRGCDICGYYKVQTDC